MIPIVFSVLTNFPTKQQHKDIFLVLTIHIHTRIIIIRHFDQLRTTVSRFGGRRRCCWGYYECQKALFFSPFVGDKRPPAHAFYCSIRVRVSVHCKYRREFAISIRVGLVLTAAFFDRVCSVL